MALPQVTPIALPQPVTPVQVAPGMLQGIQIYQQAREMDLRKQQMEIENELARQNLEIRQEELLMRRDANRMAVEKFELAKSQYNRELYDKSIAALTPDYMSGKAAEDFNNVLKKYNLDATSALVEDISTEEGYAQLQENLRKAQADPDFRKIVMNSEKIGFAQKTLENWEDLGLDADQYKQLFTDLQNTTGYFEGEIPAGLYQNQDYDIKKEKLAAAKAAREAAESKNRIAKATEDILIKGIKDEAEVKELENILKIDKLETKVQFNERLEEMGKYYGLDPIELEERKLLVTKGLEGMSASQTGSAVKRNTKGKIIVNQDLQQVAPVGASTEQMQESFNINQSSHNYISGYNDNGDPIRLDNTDVNSGNVSSNKTIRKATGESTSDFNDTPLVPGAARQTVFQYVDHIKNVEKGKIIHSGNVYTNDPTPFIQNGVPPENIRKVRASVANERTGTKTFQTQNANKSDYYVYEITGVQTEKQLKATEQDLAQDYLSQAFDFSEHEEEYARKYAEEEAVLDTMQKYENADEGTTLLDVEVDTAEGPLGITIEKGTGDNYIINQGEGDPIYATGEELQQYLKSIPGDPINYESYMDDAREATRYNPSYYEGGEVTPEWDIYDLPIHPRNFKHGGDVQEMQRLDPEVLNFYHGLVNMHPNIVITEVIREHGDPYYKPGTLHESGLALDVRTKDKAGRQLVEKLKFDKNGYPTGEGAEWLSSQNMWALYEHPGQPNEHIHFFYRPS